MLYLIDEVTLNEIRAEKVRNLGRLLELQIRGMRRQVETLGRVYQEAIGEAPDELDLF